jgi:hypothetical protein
VSPVVVGGPECEQVVVVEGQAVRAEFGESLDGLDHVQCGTGGHAERVGRGPADRPQPERELVRRLRDQAIGGPNG